MFRWFIAALVVGLVYLLFSQHTRINELQEDVLYAKIYIQSLETQALALHQTLTSVQQRTLNLSKNISYLTVELSACMLQIPFETDAPQKRVNVSDVLVSQSSTRINVQDLVPGLITPSGSMYPLLTKDTIVLEAVPKDPIELMVGDIIIYEYQETRIIHRIIRLGFDENGWFAITKGDNNPREDPFPVRFSQVRGVVVSIIY